jgi:hypothetical protein
MSFGVRPAGTLIRPHDGKTVDNNTTTKKMEGSKEKETGKGFITNDLNQNKQR